MQAYRSSLVVVVAAATGGLEDGVPAVEEEEGAVVLADEEVGDAVAVAPSDALAPYLGHFCATNVASTQEDGDVKVAGDPEKQFERDAAERGIILHAPVAASLKSLASKYNVEVPEALQSLDESKSRQSLYS